MLGARGSYGGGIAGQFGTEGRSERSIPSVLGTQRSPLAPNARGKRELWRWEQPGSSCKVTKRLSVREARANFSDLIGAVYYTREPVIVEKKGKPVMVMISPDQYAGYEQYVKSRFNDAVGELRLRNVNKDPDEVYREVTAIVEEVRQQQYEREQ
jgi:prevent-host-death family protein